MGAFTRAWSPPSSRGSKKGCTSCSRSKERRRQATRTLSGGRLADAFTMGRALMSAPKLMMLDEPSMGLAPILVEQVFDIIQSLHKAGTTIRNSLSRTRRWRSPRRPRVRARKRQGIPLRHRRGARKERAGAEGLPRRIAAVRKIPPSELGGYFFAPAKLAVDGRGGMVGYSYTNCNILNRDREEGRTCRKNRRFLRISAALILAVLLLAAAMPSALAADTRTGTVSAPTGILLLLASPGGESAGEVPDGSAVSILSEETDANGTLWYYIQKPGGETGYVPAESVTLSESRRRLRRRRKRRYRTGAHRGE